ncbi:MAG: hypothetical protein PHY85_03555 [Bacteroidales bacterium]|nr:hypothetical protein [Bacteroidales bacterium]
MKQIRTLQGKTSANANIVIRDNYITAECECDSVSIYLTMKDRYYSSDSSTFKTELKYVEKSLSWFQKLLQNLGIALAGIIITASVFGIFYFLRKLRIL